MSESKKIVLHPRSPYDLNKYIEVLGDFVSDGVNIFKKTNLIEKASYQRVIKVGNKYTLFTAHQKSFADKPKIFVKYEPAVNRKKLKEKLNWIFSVEESLKGFYKMAKADPVISKVVKQFYGLLPIKTASIFEMVITAITEQQISLLAAVTIRRRLVEKSGKTIIKDGKKFYAFPTPKKLASLKKADFLKIGLSRQKADYIHGFSRLVASGKFDVESLKEKNEEEVIEKLTQIKGLGIWTAEYVLARGMGRTDVFPADDLGVRTALGRIYGDGKKVSAQEAKKMLAKWKPYRRYATFYILCAGRLNPVM